MMNYLNEIINKMPRVLSLLDRNRFSPTYGCFDRNYWHYKIITDFPSAIFQQGVLSLTLLYKNNFNENIYYGNKNVLEWIIAGLLFWSKIQNRDGSFNEWFPEEHSHVATAFTTYAVSESILLLGDELDRAVRQKVLTSLLLSGKWLKRNKDRLVINHTAGAVSALYNIYLLTKDKFYLDAVNENINVVMKGQDEEGWFSEYGGADIGYHSVTIDYLAKYLKITQDLKVKEILGKAINFLTYFIHPDGSSGGIYGSRNTKYLMPHGIVILAQHFPTARYILKSIWQRLGEQINMFDDRYFIFFILPNLIQAGLEFKKELLEYNESNYSNYRKVFNNSGLVSIKNERFHFICNLKKGGVVNVFTKDGLIYSDSGYFGIDFKENVVTSQWFSKNNNSKVIFGDLLKTVYIKCPFVLVNSRILKFRDLFLLRIFNLSFGRIGKFASFLNRYIKRVGIIKVKRMPIILNRKINISDRDILIEDIVNVNRLNMKFSEFGFGTDETSMHVPSSMYFQKEILGLDIPRLNLEKDLNLKRRFSVSKKIRFTDDVKGPEIIIEKLQ